MRSPATLLLLLLLSSAARAQEPQPPPSATLQEVEYRTRRMRLGPMTEAHWSWVSREKKLPEPDLAWDVYQGSVPVSAKWFASETGDTRRTELLAGERARKRRQAWALAGVGGALALSAIIPLGRMEQPQDIPGGLTIQERSRATQELKGRNENRWYQAGFSLSIGTIALVAAPGLTRQPERPQSFVSNYYDQEEARDRIESFNARLRENLGLVIPALPSPSVPETAPRSE